MLGRLRHLLLQNHCFRRDSHCFGQSKKRVVLVDHCSSITAELFDCDHGNKADDGNHRNAGGGLRCSLLGLCLLQFFWRHRLLFCCLLALSIPCPQTSSASSTLEISCPLEISSPLASGCDPRACPSCPSTLGTHRR